MTGRCHINVPEREPEEILDEDTQEVIAKMNPTKKKNSEKEIVPFMRLLKRMQRQKLKEIEERENNVGDDLDTLLSGFEGLLSTS